MNAPTPTRSQAYYIEAARKRLAPLAARFGINSPQVREALTTWGALIDQAAKETETK